MQAIKQVVLARDPDPSKAGGGADLGPVVDSSERTHEESKGEANAVKSLEDRLLDLRAGIHALVAPFLHLNSDNAIDQVLCQGCGTMLMYISKLLEHPDVPRYRRVSVSNHSFKSFVLPLQGHEKVLEAVGFVRRGGYFEWTWVSSPLDPISKDKDSKSIGGGVEASAPKATSTVPNEADRVVILSECASLLKEVKSGKYERVAAGVTSGPSAEGAMEKDEEQAETQTLKTQGADSKETASPSSPYIDPAPQLGFEDIFQRAASVSRGSENGASLSNSCANSSEGRAESATAIPIPVDTEKE